MFNQSNNKLAIVIPAYKIIFFKETLQSISNQSNKDFTLYIGDDFSPDNLHEVIESFANSINIQYKRFESNLGGVDLVAHWHRCLEMVGTEEWIWLFSDDDIMEPDCVERFYNELNKGVKTNLYHFDVTRIDRLNKVILFEKSYASNLPAISFLNQLINFKITSYVVEYIFNYNHFKKLGGFENFDLAWGSDHATWLKLAYGGMIKTVPTARVRWRSSGYNITSINNNKTLSERKRAAELDFYKWLVNFFAEKSHPLPFSKFSSIRWFLPALIIHLDQYGFGEAPKWINRFSEIPGANIRKSSCYFYLFIYTLLFKFRKNKRLLRNNLRVKDDRPIYT